MKKELLIPHPVSQKRADFQGNALIPTAGQQALGCHPGKHLQPGVRPWKSSAGPVVGSRAQKKNQTHSDVLSVVKLLFILFHLCSSFSLP